MNPVIEKVTPSISLIIENLGYEVVEIEYKKEYDSMHLTFYIYKEDGVSLDDCEKVHNAISDPLDELNPTGETAYVLNVSSPGLDRAFKTQRDYERNYGKVVEVKLYAPMQGKKVLVGILKEKKEHVVVIEVDGNEMGIEQTKISLVHLVIKFE